MFDFYYFFQIGLCGLIFGMFLSLVAGFIYICVRTATAFFSHI